MHPNAKHPTTLKFSKAALRRLYCALENTTPCGSSFNQMMKELAR